MRTKYFVFTSLLVLITSISCKQINPSQERVSLKVIKTPEITNEISSLPLSPEEADVAEIWKLRGIQMLGEVYQDKDIVFSPLSLQTTLAMLAEGMSGSEREEIYDVLSDGYSYSLNYSSFCNKYLSYLGALDNSAIIKTASAFIYDSTKADVDNDYTKRLEDYFYTSCGAFDFEDKNRLLSIVNQWVSSSTDGMIPSILSDLNESDIVLIISSLLFKAGFSVPFNPDKTTKDSFKTSSGDRIQVDMMEETFRGMIYGEDENYIFISMPIGKKEKFMLTMIQPQNGDGIKDIISSLDTDSLRGERRAVRLYMPKFEIDNYLNLSSLMFSRGFPDTINSSGIFKSGPSSISVNKILQRTRIAVQENGLQAASSSLLSGDIAYVPNNAIEVKFDSPFIFLLTEGSTKSGLLLYAGVFTGIQ